MQTWVIVVAAGAGRRFGAAKQFLALGGERIVDRALRVARRHADGVVVVLPRGCVWDGPPVDAATEGGPTRSASVRAGLERVPESAEVIVVHDAARPLASDVLYDAVIAAVAEGADGAVPAVAVADTVKRVRGSRIVATIPRDDLVTVQTPQAFAAERLRAAHGTEAEGTDDAALVEAAGGVVVVVPGEPANLKVTDRDDLARAEALLAELQT